MLLNQELEKIKETVGAENYNRGKYKEATEIFNQMTTSKTFEEFLTLQAYNYLLFLVFFLFFVSRSNK